MRMLLYGLGGLVAGYAIGVAAGAGLVTALSGNLHDQSVEVAMTAAFVTGPAGAIATAIASLIYAASTG